MKNTTITIFLICLVGITVLPVQSQFMMGRGNDDAMTADEIKKETKQTVYDCANSENRDQYIDCVLNNLSTEFFWSAFKFFKKKYNKKYSSVLEEINRFSIFAANYKKIARYYFLAQINF